MTEHSTHYKMLHVCVWGGAGGAKKLDSRSEVAVSTRW